MLQTLLDILGVIGIVIVVAFVIVFLSDLFISIVDGTNGIFFRRNKSKTLDVDEDYDRPTKRPILLNEPKKEETREEEYSRREIREENSSRERSRRDYEDERNSRYEDDRDSRYVEESKVDMKKAEEEEELARKNVVNERKMANSQPIITPTPAPAPKPEPVHEPIKNESEDIDKVIAAISKQTLIEVEKEELANRAEEAKRQQEEFAKEREEAKKQQEELENKQKDLEEEIAKLKSQIEKDQSTIEDLEDKVKNAPKETEVKTEIKTIKVVKGDKAELEDRLEVLRKRLKENEKELSANRKEYVPLRRVNMTLESDKKKLRRKEAIVAKQKVVLYGVNNYVDIDEERAKKLSEELDLLEGLRLSVQHCEEVMQKNKDRFPILERANKFLVKNNTELKEDIKSLEERIAELEAQDNKDDDTNNDDGNVEIIVDDGDNKNN